jgi:transposase-like protein
VPAPLDPAKRDAIEQAIRDGGKRNEIAREHGVSGATVSKIARELEQQGDLDGSPAFDRAATKRATELREVDQAAERARLRQLLLDDAHRLRAQLWTPCVMHNFGGKDNTHNSIDLPQPTFEQQAKIMTAVGIAVDKIVRLDSSNDGAEQQAASLIRSLVDDIRTRRKPTGQEPAGAAE